MSSEKRTRSGRSSSKEEEKIESIVVPRPKKRLVSNSKIDMKTLAAAAASLLGKARSLMVLTGAGLSAESGIPTFRGPEGYWTVGSRNYRPEEMATWSMFQKDPLEVWKWYHYRMKVCKEAGPNDGHVALVELEKLYKEQKKRFVHVTQNVDGLSLRAGQDPDLTYCIHGRISQMRNGENLHDRRLFEVPDDLPTDKVVTLPTGELARPNVLWFDEMYDEELFKWDSTLNAADRMDVLLIIGSTLTTGLPDRIVHAAHTRNIPIIEVNPNPVLKADINAKTTSGQFLPEVIRILREQGKEIGGNKGE